MKERRDYADEDVGSMVLLEHVNVQIPDQAKATLFYVIGLGFTRDPYINVGLQNMWINLGEQQFHLPTGNAQVVPGHIGIVVPDLNLLKSRLQAVEERLAGTKFSCAEEKDYLTVTCPWGNRFRCYEPHQRFGDMALGMPYVEFHVKPGAAKNIASFYQKVMAAPSTVASENGTKIASVAIGRNQWLFFRETKEEISPYDGHHIAVYVANFSGPYGFFRARGLIMEDVRNHQFRFKEIVEPESGEKLFEIEHEVRSLRHPMYHRFFVNRDPTQTQRGYKRGRDAFIPFGK